MEESRRETTAELGLDSEELAPYRKEVKVHLDHAEPEEGKEKTAESR